MTKEAIAFYNKLIDNYIYFCAKEKAETDRLMRALWSTERRKVEKIFHKTFHKPIDKATTL